MSGGASRRHSSFWFYVLSKPYIAIHKKRALQRSFFLSVQNFFLTTQQFPKESETWDEVDLEQSSPKNKDVDWSEQLN